MTRRHALSLAAAAPAALSTASAKPATAVGVGSASCFVRSGYERKQGKVPFTETLRFLDYCHSIGAGGVQTGLSETGADYAKKVRAKCEEYGMYFEASGALPRDESEIGKFQDFVKGCREAGASVIRTVLFPAGATSSTTPTRASSRPSGRPGRWSPWPSRPCARTA